MNVCIDIFIKAFSALVPIIIATYIYEKWHDQKAKEVISNICTNTYEYIQLVKFSVVKNENILFHLIRNNNFGYTREQQKEAIAKISVEFNQNTSKLINNLKIIKAHTDIENLKIIIEKIKKSVDEINRLTVEVDSKYWSKGHLTLKQENEYIEKLNINIKNINDCIEDQYLEEILQKLLRYKELSKSE